MVATDRVREILTDSRALQADALEMLAQGRVRNAAEKAWGATKRATDALVLAQTGEEPERTPETGAGLRMLASLDPEVPIGATPPQPPGRPPRRVLLQRPLRPLGRDGAADPGDHVLHR